MANYGTLLLDGENLATILNHTLYLQDICDCDFSNLSIVLGAVFNLCQKMVPAANSWDVPEGNNSFSVEGIKNWYLVMDIIEMFHRNLGNVWHYFTSTYNEHQLYKIFPHKQLNSMSFMNNFYICRGETNYKILKKSTKKVK